MTALTSKENEALLKLFKDFNNDYNANSISKQIGTTPRGALKILKNLHKQGLLTAKQMGKATFYKVNLKDYYAARIIETLLINEARENASRWLSEFEDLFKDLEIAIIFGSIIRQPKTANDIDLLLIFRQKNIKNVKHFISEKNKILLKPIHPIMQSRQDIMNNLNKKDPVILNALRRGYVLHGYDKLIGVIKCVTSFQ
ncbi:hypothetical protein HY636_01690 [Candidatus Woesearchaeota archaeon]|nr:hypothetical protein [Candidatus Woesearchaeota archaeon]